MGHTTFSHALKSDQKSARLVPCYHTPPQAYTSNLSSSMVETSIAGGRANHPGFVTQSRSQKVTDMDVLQ